jgi:hypothetical protein
VLIDAKNELEHRQCIDWVVREPRFGTRNGASRFRKVALGQPTAAGARCAPRVLTMHDRAASVRSHPLKSTFGVLTPRSSNHRSSCALMPRQAHVRFECFMLPLKCRKICFDSHMNHRLVSSRAKAFRTSDRGIPNSRAIRDGVMPALNADRTAFI